MPTIHIPELMQQELFDIPLSDVPTYEFPKVDHHVLNKLKARLQENKRADSSHNSDHSGRAAENYKQRN